MDETHLQEIRDLGPDGDSAVREIVEILDRSVPESFREIETALARGSSTDVGRAAHQLKASCASVGARRMADLCVAVQSLAADAGRARPLLDELRTEWRLVRSAIGRFISRGRSQGP